MITCYVFLLNVCQGVCNYLCQDKTFLFIQTYVQQIFIYRKKHTEYIFGRTIETLLTPMLLYLHNLFTAPKAGIHTIQYVHTYIDNIFAYVWMQSSFQFNFSTVVCFIQMSVLCSNITFKQHWKWMTVVFTPIRYTFREYHLSCYRRYGFSFLSACNRILCGLWKPRPSTIYHLWLFHASFYGTCFTGMSFFDVLSSQLLNCYSDCNSINDLCVIVANITRS